MPSITGGDQLSPEYAPWAWIQGQFVWQTAQKVLVDQWEYRIGRTTEERIVCERQLVGGQQRAEQVPEMQIPEQVLMAIKNVSFSGTRERHRLLLDKLGEGGLSQK